MVRGMTLLTGMTVSYISADIFADTEPGVTNINNTSIQERVI